MSTEGIVPPHDLDAEAAVLSAAMLDPDAMPRLGDMLRPEHFYAEAHRRIYEACVDLSAVGKPVDIVQIATWLKDRERIAQVGGMPYLNEILSAAPAVANVKAYAATVRSKWRLRAMIQTCQRVAAMGYQPVEDVEAFLERAEQAIHDVAHAGRDRVGAETVRVVVTRAITRIHDAKKNGEEGSLGTSTGFERYDRMTGGLFGGDLTIVAGRPGMGKTAFVADVAANVATPHKNGVAFFSLEMPREQIALRMLCARSSVDVSKVRTGMLTPNDWGKLTTTVVTKFFHSDRIYIDDSGAITIAYLRAVARELKREFERKGVKLALVVVDYLQLMRGMKDSRSREEAISEISRGLKALAKDLDVPVIALSQLNRSVESREDKRPGLSDLRESGAIEQDADNVVFVYRDEYYDPETTDRGIAEIIIGKQRNGALGTVKVRFDKEYTRFDNLRGDYEEGDHAA